MDIIVRYANVMVVDFYSKRKPYRIKNRQKTILLRIVLIQTAKSDSRGDRAVRVADCRRQSGLARR